MGKYVSAMAAAGARLTLEKNNDKPRYLWFAILTSVVATLYQLYWDFVKDWGLLNYNSKNLWLRDDLILKKKCIYYISMVRLLLSLFLIMIFRQHMSETDKKLKIAGL